MWNVWKFVHRWWRLCCPSLSVRTPRWCARPPFDEVLSSHLQYRHKGSMFSRLDDSPISFLYWQMVSPLFISSPFFSARPPMLTITNTPFALGLPDCLLPSQDNDDSILDLPCMFTAFPPIAVSLDCVHDFPSTLHPFPSWKCPKLSRCVAVSPSERCERTHYVFSGTSEFVASLKPIPATSG